MKALSIRAPWWWYILHGGKDIENRDWSTGFRGTVLVHASKSWVEYVVEFDRGIANAISGIEMPNLYRDLKGYGGYIVGQVDVVDCVRFSKSPWFFGEYGFVLANPVAYSHPVACKGALGFFSVQPAVMDELHMRDAE